MSLKSIFNTGDQEKQWVKLADIYPKFAVGHNKNVYAVNPIIPEIIIKNTDGKDDQKVIDSVIEALLIASQSDIGYQAMSMINQLDYKIIIDLKNADSNAELDDINRLINIHDIGKNINSLALVLIHESIHGIQCNKGDIIPSIQYTPIDCIKIIMAMEADVKAFELLSSLQISTNEDSFEGKQFILPEIINDFKDRIIELEGMTNLLDKLKDDYKERDPEKILMAGFTASYQSAQFRSKYERTTLQSLVANGLDNFQKPELYTKKISSEELIDKFAMANIGYIKKHIKSLDLLDTPFYRAVSSETFKNLTLLQEERKKNPENKDEALWDFISYSDIQKEQDKAKTNTVRSSKFAKQSSSSKR